ncbi:MAG: hypothetical protein AB8F94_10930 [Saprospiraceae bacterium]
MKKKYIILIITLLGFLLFTSQRCEITDKTKTSEEGVNEEEFEMEEDNQDGDNEIGGADFNFIDAWDNFDEKKYVESVELLGLTSSYLKGESEDLIDKDAADILLTIGKIDILISALESDNINVTLLKKSFQKVGLTLVKDYLAIAVAINESPEDNQYFVTKAIMLLERNIPTLEGKEKEKINNFLNSLSEYDTRVETGGLIEIDDLQNLVAEIQKIISQKKINF